MNVISQEAFAKIAVNKSLLKEYNSSKYSRVVYLNDGDEFQIQLFNSEKHIIAAKIFIDGEELNDMLVLRPGERVWLERYLDKARKFKFSTYEIEDSAEAKEAASLNGQVKVQFYRVKTKKENPIVFVNTITPYYGHTYYNSYTASDGLRGLSAQPLGASSAVEKSYDNIELNFDLGTSYACCDSIQCNNVATAFTSVSTIEPCAATIETGRVEEGGYSNQKFSYVDYDFESYAFRTEYIQILPLSRKPQTSEDLQKRYCSNCGRKLSPKHKFCPYCGTKVD